MSGQQQGGFGLIELLVGLAVGSLVLVGALRLAAHQTEQARAMRTQAVAARELESIERLLERLAQRAVPAAGTTQAGFQVLPGGSGLRFQTRTDDGSARAVGLRLAEGVLTVQFDSGPWQSLHDPQSLRLRAVAFEVLDEPDADPATPAEACAVRLAPRLGWRLEATTADDRPLPGGARRILPRDAAPPSVCLP